MNEQTKEQEKLFIKDLVDISNRMSDICKKSQWYAQRHSSSQKQEVNATDGLKQDAQDQNKIYWKG